jgi:hypothetical protein
LSFPLQPVARFGRHVVFGSSWMQAKQNPHVQGSTVL